MDQYTDSRFTVQPSPAAAMDIDLVGEASAAGAQDLAIKRETSNGLEEDTNMADIPDLEAAIPTPASTLSKSEPRSSLPPSLPQTGSSPQPPLPKPTGPARASKKKGTATLVKKTTSRKTGSASRAGRGARGGSKAAAAGALSRGPKLAGSSASSPAAGGSSDAGGSGDEDEESDHGPYCLCRGPDDHRWMIACDMCEDWFHGECVGVDKSVGEALIVRYVCPRCSDGKGVNVTRYKKTCSLEGCFQAARVYDDAKKADARSYSVFCSDKHAEEWWEVLVRALPENKKAKAKGEYLTREKFMGLLGVQTVRNSIEGEEPWYIGKKPFGKTLLFFFPPFFSLPSLSLAVLCLYVDLTFVGLFDISASISLRPMERTDKSNPTQPFRPRSGPPSTQFWSSPQKSNRSLATRPRTAMHWPRRLCSIKKCNNSWTLPTSGARLPSLLVFSTKTHADMMLVSTPLAFPSNLLISSRACRARPSTRAIA